jgi:foldase protein PrsA
MKNLKKILLVTCILLLITGCGNVKLKNGENAAVTFKDEEGISSDELYNELKKNEGAKVLINMIDTYLLEKEYDTTSDEKDYIKEIIASVKEYATQYNMTFNDYIANYYGATSEEAFKELVSLNYRRNLWSTDYAKSQVSDKQIKEYYDNYTIGDIEASHILISTQATSDMTDDEKDNLNNEALKKAKEVIVKLNNGEDFAELAKEYSDDTASAKDGGKLGYFNRGKMVSAFEEAAIALKVGEYSKTPVKTEFGYHIIYKTNQKDKPTLEDAKDSIVEKIASETLASDSTLYAKSLVALREKYEMTIKDSVLKKGYDSLVK